MLCSVLIPTRKRVKSLMRMMDSILLTASRDNIEFVIRFDDDDMETASAIPELVEKYPLKHIVGPRLGGWGDCNRFYHECADIASGKWLLLVNDDGEIRGRKWDEELQFIPTQGYLVYPGIYQLNESQYPKATRVGFCFLPNQSWKQYGVDIIPQPMDVKIDELFIDTQGWKYHFLHGVTAYHNREIDKILSKERY